MNNEPNETLVKFGFPATVVAEYDRWVVLVRPKQVTLGSLLLVCRDDATAFSDICAEAFAGLGAVVADIEANLRREVAYEKLNYLMLMMVDPNVHFHVIPRYRASRRLHGIEYHDGAWPGPPDLKATAELTADEFEALTSHLRSTWTRR
jgi:diadenosine tetraphosphate (Ap4A) HIT family hydrolase